MQNGEANVMNRDREYVMCRWGEIRSSYRCTDDTCVAVLSKAFRLPEQKQDGFVGTDSETTFINGIVYKKTEVDVRKRIWTFVSGSEFDRSISTIVKVTDDTK